MKNFLYFASLATACVLGLASNASAQGLITWEASVNMFQGMTDQGFVDTTGDGLVALNATASTDGTQDVTVNGVAFPATGTDTTVTGVGGHSITLNGGTNNATAFGDGEFTADTDIFAVLRSGVFAVNSVTLDGLVVGTDYSIQVFTNDARANRNELFITGFGDGSGAATAPTGFSDLNNSPPGTMVDPVTGMNVLIPATFPETEVGDSIIGTFTAVSYTHLTLPTIYSV